MRMKQKNFSIFFILIVFIHPSILINLCPNHISCNCIFTNNTYLEITCNTTLSPSILPTLINNTIQSSITYLRVSSSIVGLNGPLISLPINLCSSYPHIITIDLSFNGLIGFLNTSAFACFGSNLLHVDLSYNFLTDIDLNLFQSNTQLQTINLSHNNLTNMPLIDGEYFLNFVSTITLMNFSYNQITNVDFWPLFVRTGNYMTIDMSHNLIINYTNTVPVYMRQFTNTPDPRSFYLNNNQIEHLSDLLLEQYGACSTTSSLSTSYFVVGISNILLTNNPLICDCQPYHLLTFINDRISDFPLIDNNSALLSQAQCTLLSSGNNQSYISFNFTQLDSCINYTLPQISDGFCSVYTNTTNSTIAPPTYYSSTVTTISTTIINGNETSTESDGGSGNIDSNNNNNNNNTINSSSPSWYIILGIVLGLILLLALIIIAIFLCKDRLFSEKCRSKFFSNNNNNGNLNNSYEPIIRHSELSSQTTSPLNEIKHHRPSMSTSTGGIDDQENGILQFDNDSDRISPNDHHSWNEKIHPEQETQTCFKIVRSKPSSNQTRVTRDPQRLRTNDKTNTLENTRRERKASSSTATDTATNTTTTNVVKGIPISSVPRKLPPLFPNGNDPNISELNVTSIPLTPSRRAKLLPQLKPGLYLDSTNKNLLNTSAAANVTHQRQRCLSSSWSQRQEENIITPSLIRPQSMIAQKSTFDQDNSSEEEEETLTPTMESLTNKLSKPLRALPLLNITVVSAWIDDKND